MTTTVELSIKESPSGHADIVIRVLPDSTHFCTLRVDTQMLIQAYMHCIPVQGTLIINESSFPVAP